MERRLKKSVVYSLYIVSFLLLLGGIVVMGFASKGVVEPGYKYVSKGILDYEENTPVISLADKIVRPYNDDNVNIVKNYYDYKDEATNQEKSLIYYENTYIQSSGISYSKGEAFDVVAILPGKVNEIKEDTTLGNVITLEHENGIISVYQSINEIDVNVGDEVAQGQILAKSSTSNISNELENHLYFELIIDGVCVNPEEYYGKSINEL